MYPKMMPLKKKNNPSSSYVDGTKNWAFEMQKKKNKKKKIGVSFSFKLGHILKEFINNC